MPRATTSTVAQEFPLKSCEGGWVKLRRMSYGERLHRQDIAVSMSMQQDQRSRSASMDIKQAQTKVGEFELATCVVDHNLEKDDGSKLNFKNGMDFQLLDGMIGEEIAALIEDMHNWENDLPNSTGRSESSSSAPGEPRSIDNRISQTQTPSWQPN